METDLYLHSLFALGVVLVLMLGLLWVIKRVVPGGGTIRSKDRRLKIIEALPLDHRHRLMIVRCDDRDHLIMLGHQSDLLIEKDMPALKKAVSSED